MQGKPSSPEVKGGWTQGGSDRRREHSQIRLQTDQERGRRDKQQERGGVMIRSDNEGQPIIPGGRVPEKRRRGSNEL